MANRARHQAVGHKQVRSGECMCGWLSTLRTTRERREAYQAHLVGACAARDAACTLCGRPYGEEVTRSTRRTRCNGCQNAKTAKWRAENPEASLYHSRRYHVRLVYGMTLAEYEAHFAGDPPCAICGTTGSRDSRGYRMHIDHCHTTGRVRGILCGPCNRGIGCFSDDPVKVAAAAKYLATA